MRLARGFTRMPSSPVALAHHYASLPIGIGSEVLRTHAQLALGIRRTAISPEPTRSPPHRPHDLRVQVAGIPEIGGSPPGAQG